MTGKPVQPSQQFVLAQGFRQMDGGFWALIGHDNSLRLFAELTANPDQPDVRPSEAYQVMLTSMQPGWTFRCLQIFWPDPDPRTLFQNQIEGRSAVHLLAGLSVTSTTTIILLTT